MDNSGVSFLSRREAVTPSEYRREISNRIAIYKKLVKRTTCCSVRRMSQIAAHLVELVIPHVPVLQRVLMCALGIDMQHSRAAAGAAKG